MLALVLDTAADRNGTLSIAILRFNHIYMYKTHASFAASSIVTLHVGDSE